MVQQGAFCLVSYGMSKRDNGLFKFDDKIA
jgi:hypothetical protein